MTAYLRCPACGEECEAIQPCGTAHFHCSADWSTIKGEWWCEDRSGTCSCGASLTVDVDDGVATLVEVEP